MILLRTRTARELLTHRVIKEIVQRKYFNHPETNQLLSLKGWTNDDLIQEMFLYLMSSDNESPRKIRERWIENEWSYNNIGYQKQFRAWMSKEVQSFIRNAKKLENRKRAQYWIVNSETQMLELADTKDMEEGVMNKMLIETIGKWVENECDLKEQFIFLDQINLVVLQWDDEGKTLLNYPGKPVSRRTYFNHKKAFNEKMRDYLSKRRN
jgi:hypothetical protein